MYLSIVRNPVGGGGIPGDRWSLSTKGGVRPAARCVIFNNLTSSQRATLYNMDLTNLGRGLHHENENQKNATYMNNIQCARINDISVISIGWLFVLNRNF